MQKFFQNVRRQLSPNGLIVSQTTTATDASFTALYAMMCTDFADSGPATGCASVHPFTVYIPSFSSLWSFMVAAKAKVS